MNNKNTKEIIFEQVDKCYGKNYVIKDFNLQIKDGERIILLGPSGCGKSTTLRIIAGLEDINSGNLYMSGKRVNDVPCGERNVAMVFQNYALYPHMTVAQNITYGLKAHKIEKGEIKKRSTYCRSNKWKHRYSFFCYGSNFRTQSIYPINPGNNQVRP